MKQLVQATSSNLLLLGISPNAQKKAPTEKDFPERLNANFQSFWKTAVSQAAKQTIDPERIWKAAIKLYVEYCLRQNTNPFNPKDTSGEGALESELLRNRRLVVKYIDEWKILSRFDILRMSDSLTIEMSSKNLMLRSSITLRNIPLVELIKELEARMFFRYSGPYKIGKRDWHRKIPGYDFTVGFSASTDFEGELWYEIVINRSPKIETLWSDLVFDREDRLEKFIKTTIWTPIVKTIKFNSLPQGRITLF